VLAAPGAAVGAVVVGGTVLVKWALDSAFENLWGKDFSETVSDAVLDTAEFVGNAAKNAVKAVGNAAKAVGDAISGWWKKAFA